MRFLKTDYMIINHFFILIFYFNKNFILFVIFKIIFYL